MIDSNSVMSQVRSGTAPTSWQVIPARRAFFVQGAIWGVVIAIAAVAAAAYLLLSGTVVGYGVNSQTSNNVLNFWFIVDMVVLALFLVGGIVFSITRLRSLGSADDQALVLMPDGFVMRLGPAANATRVVNYQNIATITPTVRNGNTFLVMQTTNGRRVQVQLDSRFGKPKPLAQQIQGMHAAYATANVRQGERGL
ncbi:MAG TPA: hypothetical protein VGS80_27155 [Ktedonobacterales bacterium]|nr:hypothetical protein [Ktedonobacterales bacterium]